MFSFEKNNCAAFIELVRDVIFTTGRGVMVIYRSSYSETDVKVNALRAKNVTFFYVEQKSRVGRRDIGFLLIPVELVKEISVKKIAQSEQSFLITCDFFDSAFSVLTLLLLGKGTSLNHVVKKM